MLTGKALFNTLLAELNEMGLPGMYKKEVFSPLMFPSSIKRSSPLTPAMSESGSNRY